jgi:hypothetical protein
MPTFNVAVRAGASRWVSRCAGVIVACAAAPAAFAQSMAWLPNPTTSPAGGTISALTTWDPDGDGPAHSVVLAAGTFDFGQGLGNYVATWDGVRWTPLGEAFTVDSGGSPCDFGGTFFSSRASLAVFDPDGPGPALPMPVVTSICGITSCGSTPMKNVAAYDGVAWRDVGPEGVGHIAVFPCVFDEDGRAGPILPKLWVTFLDSSGIHKVESWDGTSWQLMDVPSCSYPSMYCCNLSPDGSGPDTLIEVCRLLDPSTWRYVDGKWVLWTASSSGNAPLSFIRFDADGPGSQSPLLLAAPGDMLDGIPNSIAAWNGSDWSCFATDAPAGFYGGVAMATFDPDGCGPLPQQLMLGQYGHALKGWDGEAWEQFLEGSNGNPYALTVWDPDDDGPQPPQLVVGGTLSGGVLDFPGFARRTLSDAPEVVWEITDTVGHSVWLGPQFSETTTVAQGDATGTWGANLDDVQGQMPPNSASNTRTTGLWDPSHLEFTTEAWRGLGDCGWPPQLHTASSSLIIKAFVNGGTGAPAARSSAFAGQILLSDAGGNQGSQSVTIDSQVWQISGPQSGEVDIAASSGPVHLRASGETRTYPQYPGAHYVLAYQGNIADWAGYECVYSSILLNGEVNVRRDPVLVPIDLSVSGPQASVACTQGAEFAVEAGGVGPFSYQWQVQNPSGDWVDLASKPVDLGCGSASAAAPGASSTVVTVVSACPGVRTYPVRCVVSSACGTATSAAAMLTLCPADVNCDRVANSTDVSDFINAWFDDQAAGTLVTDWDNNGVVNSTDVSAFINSWFEDTAAGCGG